AARWIGKLFEGWLSRKAMEPPVKLLMTRVVKLLVIALTLVIALGTAGMNVAALVAGIGVAGLGVGLAVQGVLGNLVAGLTIIFTKPFRVSEYIELLGEQGQVTSIELFTTTLLHADRSRVIIPNRKIVGEILHNFGAIRQLNLTVGVAYRTDLEKALGVVRDVLAANLRVLKEPAPVVGVSELGNSSINISVKPWTSVPDFVPAGPEIYRAIIQEFRTHQIEIPFPQREVRMLNDA
ncbi:MAG TPA: mechanosensitive ion channel family protein, partial [Verrucomicrobiae bacterium]|nr:mechanosensitive ion channel family protein [Verrucomicrobiae bacterium]